MHTCGQEEWSEQVHLRLSKVSTIVGTKQPLLNSPIVPLNRHARLSSPYDAIYCGLGRDSTRHVEPSSSHPPWPGKKLIVWKLILLLLHVPRASTKVRIKQPVLNSPVFPRSVKDVIFVSRPLCSTCSLELAYRYMYVLVMPMRCLSTVVLLKPVLPVDQQLRVDNRRQPYDY